jgi:hypothetical protein
MVDGRSGEFEPVYLTLENVLELHALIIGATAAEAADQLRNRAGLESAIARPETYAHYQDADLTLQAAVLCAWDRRGPVLHRRQQAHGADRDARLPRDQRLAYRSLGPRTEMDARVKGRL